MSATQVPRFRLLPLLAILVVVALLAAACGGSSDESGRPVKVGNGAKPQGTEQDVTRQIAETLLKAAASKAGGAALAWVSSLILPGDKSQAQLDEIQAGLKKLDDDVQALRGQVAALGSQFQQAFTEIKAAIGETSLTPARGTIDTANNDLADFLENAGTGEVDSDFVAAYGKTAANPLMNALVQMNTVLTVGGATGDSLITTAHKLFAAKPQPPFDDRPLRQQLGLPISATQADVKAKCAALPTTAKQICSDKPTYYDNMSGVVQYYVAYQLNALQALVVARAATGSPAALTATKNDATLVWNNIREQLLQAGAPLSTADAVLENGVAPNYESGYRLWQREPVRSTTLAQPAGPAAPVRYPTDCAPIHTGGGQCTTNDPPYKLDSTNATPATPLCLLQGARGSARYGSFQRVDGIARATAADLRGCQGTTTGLRVPMSDEFITATQKGPQGYDALRLAGPEMYLTYTPAQVACGYSTKSNSVSENVNNDSTINGLAETWALGAGGWASKQRYNWFNWKNAKTQAAAAPCFTYQVDFSASTPNTLQQGFIACDENNVFVHDVCYGRANYTGEPKLPAAGDPKMSVWPVQTVARCAADLPDQFGHKPGPHDTNSCTQQPVPGRWEIPACTTPSGRWTLCGDKWVDDVWPPAATVVSS